MSRKRVTTGRADRQKIEDEAAHRIIESLCRVARSAMNELGKYGRTEDLRENLRACLVRGEWFLEHGPKAQLHEVEEHATGNVDEEERNEDYEALAVALGR